MKETGNKGYSKGCHSENFYYRYWICRSCHRDEIGGNNSNIKMYFGWYLAYIWKES